MEPPETWLPFDVNDRRTYPQLYERTRVLFADGHTTIGDFLQLLSHARVEKKAPIVGWRYIGKVMSMSCCLEYLRLHKLYVQALRRWSEANLIKDDGECFAADEKRELAFSEISRHRRTCPQCVTAAMEQPRPGGATSS